jgi:hypothetical protein
LLWCRAEEEGEPRIVLTQDTDDNLTLGAEGERRMSRVFAFCKPNGSESF